MAKLSEMMKSLAGDVLVAALGWGVCLIIVVALYDLGYWVAPQVGWNRGRETLGVLSAIAGLWAYEHSHFDGRIERLSTTLEDEFARIRDD